MKNYLISLKIPLLFTENTFESNHSKKIKNIFLISNALDISSVFIKKTYNDTEHKFVCKLTIKFQFAVCYLQNNSVACEQLY